MFYFSPGARLDHARSQTNYELTPNNNNNNNNIGGKNKKQKKNQPGQN